MCRLFAASASAPVDVSFELLRSDNSILRQSEEHDSGWGSAYYSEDGVPDVRRFADAAHADESFDEVTSGRARLIMVHVRRATIGGLKLENTHPFSRGPYTYCHNGTILKAAQLEPLADTPPAGDTDSERFFNMLMTGFDHDDVIGSLRRAVETVCDTCRFSALNFLFCDGRRMYAYRFGVYRLFWLARDLDLDADTGTHHHVHLERPQRRARGAGRQRAAHRGRAVDRVRTRTSCWCATRTTPSTRASSACSATARMASSSCRSTPAS